MDDLLQMQEEVYTVKMGNERGPFGGTKGEKVMLLAAWNLDAVGSGSPLRAPKLQFSVMRLGDKTWEPLKEGNIELHDISTDSGKRLAVFRLAPNDVLYLFFENSVESMSLDRKSSQYYTWCGFQSFMKHLEFSKHKYSDVNFGDSMYDVSDIHKVLEGTGWELDELLESSDEEED